MKKKMKKSVKLIMAGSLVFTMVWSNNYHTIHADNPAQPSIISQPDIPQASWEKFAKVDIGGKTHTALDKDKGLLSDTASASNASSIKDADNLAKSYTTQANFSSKEQGVISSKLPTKLDLASAYDPGASGGTILASVIPKLSTWWWNETVEKNSLKPVDETFKERQVRFANAVSPLNNVQATYSSVDTYSCVLRGATEYTSGGCKTAKYPGEIPLSDFRYDGGYVMQKVDFPQLLTQMMQLKAAGSYTSTYYYSDFSSSFPSLNRVDQNSGFNRFTQRYEGTTAGVQKFANFAEFDYPIKEPQVNGPFVPTITQEGIPIYYNTFLPVKAGTTIKANEPIVLIGITKASATKFVVVANYIKYSTDMYVEPKYGDDRQLYLPEVKGVDRREFKDAKDNALTNILPEVIAPKQVAVRPMVTIDPANILYFKNAESGQSAATSNTLDNDIQFIAPSSVGISKPVKATIKDATQHVDKVSVPQTGGIPNDPNILKVDESSNTIYVKPKTQELKLKVEATHANDSGTTSYITALGRNINTNKIVSGRLAKSSTAATDVTLNLSNLLNTNTLGYKATVNLYTEELGDAHKSDYIAATPYPITVVVSQDQTIGFDTATQALHGSDVTYGDKDIAIQAFVTNADGTPPITQIWDPATPINVSIDTTDPTDADTAEVLPGSVDWNGGFGRVRATIRLKDGAGGTDGKIKININKPASADGRYLAAQQKQIVLNVHKRAISITPTMHTMHVDDPYPPTSWPYKAVMTMDPMVDGLVNGDSLPYIFTTANIGAISGGSDAPPLNVDGTTIKDTAIDKQWGINLTPESQAAVAAFEKKYIPTLHDYQAGNKKAILQVKRMFDPIQISDIRQQPQYVEVKPDEAKATFATTFTYPIQDVNGKSIDATYQDLGYQWYKKDALGKIEPIYPVTVKMEILPNLSATQGQARFSFSIDPVQSDDNLTSYYCEVWNDMNVSNPIRTNEAQLTMIQDPVSYVEIPQKIEITQQDKTVNVIQKDSEVQLRTLTDQDKATPKGVFDIQSDPQVKLYLNGDETITDFNKIYTMKVLKADGIQVGSDKLLTKLSYPSLKKAKFTLKNEETDKKEWGKYSGQMTFTMTYKPSTAPASATAKAILKGRMSP